MAGITRPRGGEGLNGENRIVAIGARVRREILRVLIGADPVQ